ncbi:MAG: hypothetical protein H3C62_05875 [Gemmatimonadaceae bacterium]|nr:hypothetical protein [Gemmatimonadaceae bacterium]
MKPPLERWTVCWHSAPPADESGDQSPDDAVPHSQEFSSYDAAKVHAKLVATRDWFGVATIRHWVSVTRAELDAALSSASCGVYDVDPRRRLIWLADGDVEEVEAEC